MKRFIKLPLALVLVVLFSSNATILGQPLKQDKNDFFEKTTLRLHANIFSQNKASHTIQYLSDDFYSNPLVGIEMDYAVGEHFLLNSGLSYEGAREQVQNSITFVIAPEPDALTNFEITHSFQKISLEPKAKIAFDLKNVNLFWGAGPIISAAFLNSKYNTAPYEGPQDFTFLKKHQSWSFTAGAQAITGIQYSITDRFGISGEVGYKYLKHDFLEYELDVINERRPFRYNSTGFINRIGIVYKL